MLRYCYLLSLLICINNSFCYEYTSNLDLNKSPIGRVENDHQYQRENFKRRKHRKRHDYDMLDKDPVAEIDVASFINSPEESISENDPYNLYYKRIRNGKQDNYYDSLANDISNNNEDYIEVEKLQEISHNNNNYDISSKEKTISDKFTRGFDKIHQDNLDDNLIKHNEKNRKEKKCVFKHIKLPFFSHNKTAIAKVKKDKRRKNNSFYNSRRGNVNRENSNENLLKNLNSRDTSNLGKHNNIKKRSYFERFCPACRRKFIISKTLRSQTKRKNTHLDLIPQNFEGNSGNTQKHPNKYYIDANIPTSNEKGSIENSWSDRRRKREDDDRNIERQKELEYLEKRVESVTVNNPSYNRNKL